MGNNIKFSVAAPLIRVERITFTVDALTTEHIYKLNALTEWLEIMQHDYRLKVKNVTLPWRNGEIKITPNRQEKITLTSSCLDEVVELCCNLIYAENNQNGLCVIEAFTETDDCTKKIEMQIWKSRTDKKDDLNGKGTDLLSEFTVSNVLVY